MGNNRAESCRFSSSKSEGNQRATDADETKNTQICGQRGTIVLDFARHGREKVNAFQVLKLIFE
jgi:hypothetical protein